MKMDSLSKSSTASSSRSSTVGGGGGVAASLHESAHFANIMVEFENNTREMAVDVPDSFIAQSKTPPKYPPPPPHALLAKMNGAATPASPAPPPLLSARDHLRIEQDGHLLNTRAAPSPPARPSGWQQTTPTPTPTTAEETRQLSQRMREYSDQIVQRQLEMDRKSKVNDFLRHSIRNSQKMRNLKEGSAASVDGVGVANLAFVTNEGPSLEAGQPQLRELLQQLVNNLSMEPALKEAMAAVTSLADHLDFQQALEVNQKILQHHSSKRSLPLSTNARELTVEVMGLLEPLETVGEHDDDDRLNMCKMARELACILCHETMEGLLSAHDKIGHQRAASSTGPGTAAAPEASPSTSTVADEDALLDRLSHYSEPNIKIVRIEKTSEPLGATVKNEDDAVVVGRIIRGGTAEASGLLHEGDEILEVNDVPMRGKNVNEVCDILTNMQGTLILLVVPTQQMTFPSHSHSHSGVVSSSPSNSSTLSRLPGGGQNANTPNTNAIMHVKAHISYDPEEDPYVPCRELGISFQKGEILHVINQKDPHWWQARREGEEDTQLPGLIPSASFQQQREAVKHTIAASDDLDGTFEQQRRRKSSSTAGRGFLCAKKSGRSKKRHRGVAAGIAAEANSPSAMSSHEEILTYEEVALYYPRSDRKRPVVLIGPPNIGRHELRQRLMQDGDRFAAAIPHTSRPRRPDEVDGQDYHFISRLQFEQDILTRKFVEHGEYEKSFYGTSLNAIRSVVRAEKICALNLHPHALKILKTSDLMPFVVFVAPPSLDKLKRWKLERSEAVNDEALRDIIERAREMEEAYGHYFDMVIVYADPDKAYQDLIKQINLLEREPQWVPASWLRMNNDDDAEDGL